MAARYRPAAKIIAMTPFKKTCRKLAIVWGVSPVLVRDYKSADEIPEVVNDELQKLGLIKKGESFVITGGVPVGISGTTNYLTVLIGS
jgi:pyruvate kinase